MKFHITLLCSIFTLFELTLAFNSQQFPLFSASSFPKPSPYQLNRVAQQSFFNRKSYTSLFLGGNDAVSWWFQLKETLLNCTTICSLACVLPPVAYSIFEFLIFARQEALEKSSDCCVGVALNCLCCAGGSRRLIRKLRHFHQKQKPSS
jgi:hypothetical protein